VNTLVLDAPIQRPVAARSRIRSRAPLLAINTAALLAVAVLLRSWHLGNIAGVNGDEAWSGVQALRLLGGEGIAWRTPTGNLINGFMIGPLAALHFFFAPSVWLLRLPALVSGLMVPVVNYWLCRRAFDQRTAVISSLILALLPINIAYSRFGWDASQSVLFTLPVLYLPLLKIAQHSGSAKLSGWAIVACGAAIVVHPTNVFAAVLLVAPYLYVRRKDIFGGCCSATRAKPWSLGILVVTLALAGLAAWRYSPNMLGRLHGPGELLPTAIGYLQLFSGTTIFQYVSGAGTDAARAGWFAYTTVAGSLGFALLAAIAGAGMVRRMRSTSSPIDASLICGWSAMLLGFFLVAGPTALAPHFERYGMCLIAPGVLVLARGLAWWLEQPGSQARRAAIYLAVAAWLWPASFMVNYFQCFVQTGGLSHRTFRTAQVEPKQAALEFILAQRDGDRPLEIVCQEWWNYWALRYLSDREPGVTVRTWEAWRDRRNASGGAGDTWFVEFSDSAARTDALRYLHRRGLAPRQFTVVDYGRRPILTIVGQRKNYTRIVKANGLTSTSLDIVFEYGVWQRKQPNFEMSVCDIAH
jgi:4-amino-4-deoxy-L-arabinose transferase-like glycosyltransferase